MAKRDKLSASVNFTKAQHYGSNIFQISYKHIKNSISRTTENKRSLNCSNKEPLIEEVKNWKVYI